MLKGKRLRTYKGQKDIQLKDLAVKQSRSHSHCAHGLPIFP
jgi:hypothetical protein